VALNASARNAARKIASRLIGRLTTTSSYKASSKRLTLQGGNSSWLKVR